MMYKIVRYYYPKAGGIGVGYHETHRRPRTIKTRLTLEQAQAHCQDPKTRKEGEYFDGYVET
jgi:hypothetical protein